MCFSYYLLIINIAENRYFIKPKIVGQRVYCQLSVVRVFCGVFSHDAIRTMTSSFAYPLPTLSFLRVSFPSILVLYGVPVPLP